MIRRYSCVFAMVSVLVLSGMIPGATGVAAAHPLKVNFYGLRENRAGRQPGRRGRYPLFKRRFRRRPDFSVNYYLWSHGLGGARRRF